VVLPHPKYVCKLAGNSNSNNVDCLKQRIDGLNDDEKLINVLLDETHVKSAMSYKGGKVTGSASNSEEIADSLQAFMITSLRSGYKDVVSLFPVKNITGLDLLKYTKDVLLMLRELGFKVITLISDNNRLNRKMFEQLCGGILISPVANPVDTSSPIFLLFDTVHLFKCIRNNWINQRNPAQTFIIPSSDNVNVGECISFKQIVDLYNSESASIVKLAPQLSQKVLFPSNFDRQNVQYAVNLFNEKNIAALSTTGFGTVGLVNFMKRITSWWNIVNVKTLLRGKRSGSMKHRPYVLLTIPNWNFYVIFISGLKRGTLFQHHFRSKTLHSENYRKRRASL